MKLSKHVSRAEFEQSETATRRGINNVMNDEQLGNAIRLCENVFEPLRAYVGKPVFISSGFRSPELNKRIGGSTTSQHCKGEAMDIKIGRAEFLWIRDNLTFDQMIYEFGNDSNPQWVHVSYAKINRKQVLRAIKLGGKTKYINYK